MDSIHHQLIAVSRHMLEWNRERIERCLAEVGEAQFWQRPNAGSNSLGNQLLHLAGNLRQWIIGGLGGAPDVRKRPAEFAAGGGATKSEAFARLSATVDECLAVLESLGPEELVSVRPVQLYEHDGTFILVHAVEHFSYHTGQIIFWTKQLREGIDLNFYPEIDTER